VAGGGGAGRLLLLVGVEAPLEVALEAEEETLRRGAVGGGAVGEVGDATDEGGEATGGEATGEATGGEATGGIT